MAGNLKKSWHRLMKPSTGVRATSSALAALRTAFASRVGPTNQRTSAGMPPEESMTSSSEVRPSESPRTMEPTNANRRRRSGEIATSLVIAGLILLVGFAPASRLAAWDLPRSPPGLTPVVTGSPHGKATAVRDVPVGLPRGVRIQTTADVLPYAVAALGRANALALMAALKSSDLGGGPVGQGLNPQFPLSSIEYPYRYPVFDALIHKAAPASFASGAMALGAALTVLAAQPSADAAAGQDQAIRNAGSAAYSVLNRARAAGGCAPQLDLLLVVTAELNASQGVLGREEQRTEAACPDDPTPGWLVGQSLLRKLLPAAVISDFEAYNHAMLQSAIATFRRLAAEYPNDIGVLTGLGDAYLRTGTDLRLSEPFTARQDLRSAIAEYNRAAALGDTRDAALGLARALIGLSEPTRAARVLQAYTRTSGHPGPWLELLIAADEAAHDFGAAQTTAQRLDQLGVRAYPDGVALFPSPQGYRFDSLDDTSLPLSFGAGRLTSLSATLIYAGGAEATVQDMSFIPQYRDDSGVTGTDPSCASWTWRRDALLNGHPAEALAGWPTLSQFNSVQPGRCEEFAYYLEQIAMSETDQTIGKSISGYNITDGEQNLLRWAGELPAAKKLAEHWQAVTGDKDGLPAFRLGEIEFLMHQYNDAATEFGLAARRFYLVSYNNDLAVDQAELDRGAALLAVGRTSEGAQLLRPLDLAGTHGYTYQISLKHTDTALQFAAVSYYACEQLADYERESGNLYAAAEDYTTALNWLPRFNAGSGFRPEVLDNNAALAYLGLGGTSTAVSLESKALAVDPVDPAFLMTAGFIADRAGRTTEAARYDREALDSDPGAFPAANDLGVELTREHHDATAAAALRQAVGASPTYALGWFNLGVLESKLGLSHLPASQGAFAVAFSLDPALKDRRPDMTIDAKVYRTALDLSKPLPPRWSFSQLERPAPAAAVGLLAIVTLGLALAKASGHGGSAIAGQWLDTLSGRLHSVSWLQRLGHPGWALTATLASFLLSYLRRAAGLAEIVIYAVGVLVLAVAAMAARATVARRLGIRITQSSWVPTMVLGLATGAIGLPWAALPVVRTNGDDNRRLHLAAPLTLAVLSLVLFVEAAWLHTPITQAWAVAALIMSASTLLPVGPLDGAHVGTAGVVAAVGIAGGALLVGLGLI